MKKNVIKYITGEKLNSNPGGTFYTSFAMKFFDKLILEFHGMGTGCGIMQCYGVRHLNCLNDEQLEIVKNHLINEFNNNYNNVGIIIATLGPEGRYGNSEEHLIKAGFIRLADYNNWYDTTEERGHIARLYGLKLNYKGKSNV